MQLWWPLFTNEANLRRTVNNISMTVKKSIAGLCVYQCRFINIIIIIGNFESNSLLSSIFNFQLNSNVSQFDWHDMAWQVCIISSIFVNWIAYNAKTNVNPNCVFIYLFSSVSLSCKHFEWHLSMSQIRLCDSFTRIVSWKIKKIKPTKPFAIFSFLFWHLLPNENELLWPETKRSIHTNKALVCILTLWCYLSSPTNNNYIQSVRSSVAHLLYDYLLVPFFIAAPFVQFFMCSIQNNTVAHCNPLASPIDSSLHFTSLISDFDPIWEYQKLWD